MSKNQDEIFEIKKVIHSLFEKDFHVVSANTTLTFPRSVAYQRGYGDFTDDTLDLKSIDNDYGIDLRFDVNLTKLSDFPQPYIRRADVKVAYHPENREPSENQYGISFVPVLNKEKRVFAFIYLSNGIEKFEYHINLRGTMISSGYREVENLEELDEISVAVLDNSMK